MLTELLLKDLDERSKAVGGAGCVGDDGILVSVAVSVHTDNIRRDVTLAGSSDQDLLGSGLDMLASTLIVNEDTSALNNEVNAQLAAEKS